MLLEHNAVMDHRGMSSRLTKLFVISNTTKEVGECLLIMREKSKELLCVVHSVESIVVNDFTKLLVNRESRKKHTSRTRLNPAFRCVLCVCEH